MKSIMLSIQPYYVFLIIARIMGWDIPQHKTVEVRKDAPKDSAWNRRVHIYCSKNRKSFRRIPKPYQPLMEKFLGKVVGEFECDKVKEFTPCAVRLCGLDYNICVSDFFATCLTDKELNEYGKDKLLYGWHISDLKIYDEPKELGEIKFNCQHGYNDASNAWCYRERGEKITMCKYNDMQNHCCNAYLTRPPQSWCYVEEL